MQKRVQSAVQLSPQYYRYQALSDTHHIWKDGSYKQIKKNGTQISKFRTDFTGFATFQSRKGLSITQNNPKTIYQMPKSLLYRRSKIKHFTTNKFYGYTQFPRNNCKPHHLQKPKSMKIKSSDKDNIRQTQTSINKIFKERHSNPTKNLTQQEKSSLRQEFQFRIQSFCEQNYRFKTSLKSILNTRPNIIEKKSCYNGICSGLSASLALGKKRATRNAIVISQSFHQRQIDKENWEITTISKMVKADKAN